MSCSHGLEFESQHSDQKIQLFQRNNWIFSIYSKILVFVLNGVLNWIFVDGNDELRKQRTERLAPTEIVSTSGRRPGCFGGGGVLAILGPKRP